MLSHGEGEDLKNATLYIPDSKSILKSVTTKSIADIAAKTFGWKVAVAPILFEDVKVSIAY
jgi:branched-chain amino acid aminotransferase